MVLDAKRVEKAGCTGETHQEINTQAGQTGSELGTHTESYEVITSIHLSVGMWH